MSHRRAPRHTAIRALCRLFTRSPRPVHTCACGLGLPIEEPVRPLPVGHMRQRPGGVFQDTLLGPAATPSPVLADFHSGTEVRMTAACGWLDADSGITPGQRGRVARVAPFRKFKPIGVRVAGPWAPLAWFDPEELELVEADTAVLNVEWSAVERVEGAWIAQAAPADLADTREFDALPLLDGAR